MINRLPIIILFGLYAVLASSQEGEDIDLFAYHADVMRNAQVAEHRLHSAAKFESLFKSALEEKDAFENSFQDIRNWASFLYAPDSSFRIITWQIDEKEIYSYRGFIQFQDGNIIQLTDRSNELSDVEFDVLNETSWYGALYYDIVQLSQTKYLLLGYHGVNQKVSRKIAEIVDFDKQGVTFGSEIFITDPDPIRPTIKTRIVLEFSELAAVRMAYDRGEDLLFYDHLIPVESYENKGETVMVQDGSYCGFQLKEGQFHFVDKLFNTSVDEPPRERPIQKESRDIMGRSKG